jgi:hypothetical protein
MTHRMILVSHDFKEVKALVVAKRKAPLVESAQHDFRNVEATVRSRDGAPQDSELPVKWRESAISG